MLLQVCQRPFDRAAGEIEVFGYGLDAGPTASGAVGSILEVHIDGNRPGWQIRVRINGIEVTHGVSS